MADSVRSKRQRIQGASLTAVGNSIAGKGYVSAQNQQKMGDLEQTVAVQKQALATVHNSTLVPDDGTWLYKPANVRLDPHTGLDLPGGVSRDDFDTVGWILFSMEDAIQLAIGDFINEGKDRFGIESQEFAEQYNRDVATIQDYSRVSNNVGKPLRRGGLYFSHYKLVASTRYSDKDRDDLLQDAIDDPDCPGTVMTVQRFTEYLRNRNGGDGLPSSGDRAVGSWTSTMEFLNSIWAKVPYQDRQTIVENMRQFIKDHPVQ